jgi:hypothetical protein
MARKKASKKKARFGKKSREWRKNKSSSGSNYLNALPDGFEFFNPKGGKKYTFDILPYVVKNPKQHPAAEAINEDGLFWCLPYRLHRNIGPNDLAVICPKSIGKPCCVCDERSEIYDDPDRDDDEAKALNSSPRCLFVVKILKGPEKGEIKIFDISDFCFLDAVNEELDDLPEEYEDFACLEDGYSLEVRFKEEKIGKTPFPKASKVSFIERKKDYDEDILEEVPCLDDLITWTTPEKMERLFYGDDPGEVEEEEKNKKKTKKRIHKDKEPDEPEEVDDDDDDEEEEAELDLEWDDLLEMEKEELLEVIENEDIDIDEDEAEDADEDELRDFIAQEMGIKKPIKSKKVKKKKGKKEKKTTKKERDKKKKGKTKSTKNALKCPYAYNFGVEFEDHEECDEEECDMYEKCLEAFENEE